MGLNRHKLINKNHRNSNMHFNFPTLIIFNKGYRPIFFAKWVWLQEKDLILVFGYGSSSISNIISGLNVVNILPFISENFTTGCFVMYKSLYNINNYIKHNTLNQSFILRVLHSKTTQGCFCFC